MKTAVFSACPQLYDGGRAYQDAIRCSENYEDTLTLARSAGLDGIELATCDPEDFDTGAFEAALDSTGAGVSMFGNFHWCTKRGISMLAPDDGRAELASRLFKRMIAIGAPRGIPAGLGKLRGGALPDKPAGWYEDRLCDILKDVAKYAESVGGLFCIEPQSRFSINMINTTASAVRLIERVGSDSFRLTLDVQHMYIEEDVIEGLYRGRERLYNLHLMEGYDSIAEQDGKIGFPQVIKVLRSIGFDGWVSFTLPRSAPKDARRVRALEECAGFVNSLTGKYSR